MTEAAVLPKKMGVAEYLEFEAQSKIKHHFINGNLHAMPGGTLKHNTITSNIITSINNAVRQKNLPFIISNSETKIWVPEINSFYYPDAVVIFEKPKYYRDRRDIILNPLLIVEVASSSTESFDRGDKFLDYSTLPSFKEYVLVHQDQPLVRLSNRVENDLWQVSTVAGIEQVVDLKAINVRISMADIYFRTEDL